MALPAATPETLHTVGVDVETAYVARLIRAVSRWVKVRSAVNNGAYHADRNYSQVIVTSTMDMSELGKRLDALNHVSYIGLFHVGED